MVYRVSCLVSRAMISCTGLGLSLTGRSCNGEAVEQDT